MGEALTEDLVSKGWQVAMADIKQNTDLASKLGASASFHHCDVADYDSQAGAFQEIWDKYGRLDALCANAGIVDKSSIYIFGHRGSDMYVPSCVFFVSLGDTDTIGYRRNPIYSPQTSTTKGSYMEPSSRFISCGRTRRQVAVSSRRPAQQLLRRTNRILSMTEPKQRR